MRIETEWLKASKRAYNYFSTIGDLTNMAKLEPLFSRGEETNVEQYAVVVDAIKQALVTKDPMGPKQEGSRIITVDIARQQVETVAKIVETKLPDSVDPRRRRRLPRRYAAWLSSSRLAIPRDTLSLTIYWQPNLRLNQLQFACTSTQALKPRLNQSSME